MPEVRIVDNQQVTSVESNVSQSEVDYLLAKYGFKQNHISNQAAPHSNPQTFEEMVQQQESERQRVENERRMKLNGPKPISFDSKNISFSETKWSDMDIEGQQIGVKIQIVTDMKF